MSATRRDAKPDRQRSTPVQDPTTNIERELAAAAGGLPGAGIDEVGRGAACGPVVCAAVIPGPDPAPAGIRDSKLLRPAVRAALERQVKDWAAGWGIGEASATEIDTLGMTAALGLAARRALAALDRPLGWVLLDGPVNYIGEGYPVTAVKKADLTCTCVAAASIIAKQYRDRLVAELGEQYPQYPIGACAGYLTGKHLAALREHGPVPGLHRMSWKFIDELPGYEHLKVRPAR